MKEGRLEGEVFQMCRDGPSQCPLKKKDKDEKHDSKVATVKIEREEFAMTVEIPLGRRWADLEF